jgi:hypothetical protein
MDHRVGASKLLGTTFVKNSLDEVIFKCGRTEYSKLDMVDSLGCGNFAAAKKLSKALERIGVQSITQLVRLGPLPLARMKGVGPATLYVAMCILDAHGGHVERWWGWDDGNGVKFSALKHRELQKAKREGVHE